jgi:hypothetical protein
MGLLKLLLQHAFARRFGLPALYNWISHVGRRFILSEIRNSNFGRGARGNRQLIVSSPVSTTRIVMFEQGEFGRKLRIVTVPSV